MRIVPRDGRLPLSRRLLASLVPLCLACSGEPGAAATAAAGSSGPAGASSGEPGTTDAPTTAAPDDTGTTAAPTSSPTAASSSTATTTAPDDPGATTATTGDDTTPPMTATTTDPPPRDPCADQDDAPPDVAEPGGLNEDPRYVQVYVNNVENLLTAGETCKGDWTDFIYYMKSYEPSPDLFLVQQIADSDQLTTLVERMNQDLVGAFEGVIADGDPPPGNFPCGDDKHQQTNAIIFRSGRFEKTGTRQDWLAWASDGADGCKQSNQPRTRAIMTKLHDKIADKDVTVASIHWPTAGGTGADPACAEKNVADVHARLHQPEFAADLVIFGGDFNESDRKDDDGFRDWYATANGSLGGPFNYRDPIYRMCEPQDLLPCLADNWTLGNGRRIDMLFAQDGDGCRAKTRRAHTITFNEADAAALMFEGQDDAALEYSDHRGVRTEIYY